MPTDPVYTTNLGIAYCDDSLEMMRSLAPDSVDLVVTSPPYALHFKKEYGNEDQDSYIKWFLPFAREIRRILRPTGSFVLNIGGTWTPGAPHRSLYQFKLLIALCDDVGFNLAQEFFWYNPAKMPAPAEWVNVRRIRVKDSVEYIFWLTKDASAKADNRRVLQPYSKDMQRLMKRGLKQTRRPSGHLIKDSWTEDQGGSIPGNLFKSDAGDTLAAENLIECGNNESNSEYIRCMKELGRKIHPARFPASLPRFFISFLTDPEDLVLDPFAGSNTTGSVAQELGRKWISVEMSREYAEDSAFRFEYPAVADLRAPEIQGKLFDRGSAVYTAEGAAAVEAGETGIDTIADSPARVSII